MNYKNQNIEYDITLTVEILTSTVIWCYNWNIG